MHGASFALNTASLRGLGQKEKSEQLAYM